MTLVKFSMYGNARQLPRPVSHCTHLNVANNVSCSFLRSAYFLLRARPKAERLHRQLAEIFHIERPGPA